jgi:lysophospholipase L1-like esterase
MKPWLFFSLLLASLLLAACKKDEIVLVDPGPPPPDTTVLLRYLALGDSYTIGQSVEASARFPNQTINILRRNGFLFQYPAQFIAQTGFTTNDLLNSIQQNAGNLTPPYDLVSLLIGVNNQYRGLDTNSYRIEFQQCLNKAITLSGGRPSRVFVLSIPDYGATPFGSGNAAQIGREIDGFNAVNESICWQYNVSYTNITGLTRLAATNPTLICSDSLHPSAIAYQEWAELLAPKMQQVIQ